MSDQVISVQLELDNKSAKQASEAFRKDQQQLNQKLLSDSEAAERAQTVIIERENKKRIDAIVARSEGKKEQEAKALTQVEVTEAAKTQAVMRENQRRIAAEVSWMEAAKGNSTKALTDIELKEAAKSRMVQKENEKRIADLIKASTKEEAIVKDTTARELTDHEVSEAAKSRITQRENERRIAEKIKAGTVEKREQVSLLTAEQIGFEARGQLIKKYNSERIKAAMQVAEVEEETSKRSGEGVLTLGKALGSFAVQMIGLQSAQAVIGKIVDGFEKARDLLLNSVDSLKEYREQVLELAALKDNLGETTDTVREQLRFRAKTLQTRSSADEFQKAILGAGESVIDTKGRKGLMSPDEFKKFMVSAGQFQSAEGGSAETHGTLAGLIPQNAGKRLTAKEAFAIEEKLYSIFKPGVFQNFTSAANQYQKLTPMIQNKVFSDVQGAALMSAFSTSSKEEAGTMTKWLTDATLGAVGREGMPRVEGAEAIGKFYKQLKLDDQSSIFQIADAVSEEMNKADLEATKQGKEFNAVNWLMRKGYQNRESRDALMAYRGAKNSGQLAMFMDLANQAPKGEAAARINEFQNRDMVGINRRVGLETEAAGLQDAAATEYYKALMQHAYNAERADNPGGMKGTFEEYMNDWKFGGQRRLHQRAASMLMDEFKRTGGAGDGEAMARAQRFLDPGFMGLQVQDVPEMSRRFLEVRDRIAESGGNVLPGGNVLNQTDAMLDEKRIPKPEQPAPPPAKMPNAPGPQAMFMGFRGALASSLVSGLPGGEPPGGGGGAGESIEGNAALVEALNQLTAVMEKVATIQGKGGAPKPLVKPEPALRR